MEYTIEQYGVQREQGILPNQPNAFILLTPMRIDVIDPFPFCCNSSALTSDPTNSNGSSSNSSIRRSVPASSTLSLTTGDDCDDDGM